MTKDDGLQEPFIELFIFALRCFCGIVTSSFSTFVDSTISQLLSGGGA